MLAALVGGAAAGFAATVPMTAVMDGVRRLLPADQQAPIPPRQITERAAAAVGADDLSEGETDAATAAAHFAFGAGTGAVYALLSPVLPGRPAVRGVGFGLAVWAASYLGWLPAAGLYKRPRHEQGGRHLTMILSHVVWGGTLGTLHDALTADGSTRAA